MNWRWSFGWRALVASASIALATTISSAVAAQDAATLTRYRPGPTPDDDFHLSRPADLGHLRFGAQLHVDYANDPLVWLPDAGPQSRIVAHQLSASVGFALGLADRLVFFAGLPVVALMRGDSEEALLARGLGPPDGAGLANAQLGGRVRLYGEASDVFALALQATATFPTAGRSQRLRGEDFLTLRPEVLAELRLGRGARVVLNLGAIVRRNVESPETDLRFSDELTFGVGVAMPVWTTAAVRVDAHAQIYGNTAFDDAFGRAQSALEATVGAKLFHETGIVVGLAAGPGLAPGFGSPDVRVIASVAYARRPRAPVEPAPRPVVDTDGDGIADDRDRCVTQPEDVDGFEDEDGCPDLDHDRDGVDDDLDRCPTEPGPAANEGCPDTDADGDGVVDRLDRCPSEPEDRDGFEDADGCPDPDNDGDGLLDADDACPNESGPAANRGCPDTDRDGDGVVDRLDNCPDVPGAAENQGCPTEQLVRMAEDRLEILDAVYFATNRDVIQSRSFPLLENVARVLNAHPEIRRIRVEGHTDSRGRRDANVALSQRRAEAVVRFLVERGDVAAGRFEARGFGPDRPLVERARSRADHARNRRVEIHFVRDAEE
ncbi:MAG: OmpA family protein [Myxococcales bacterium]|nr:OmpA family protein [Myxococcales bacterium]